MVIGDGTTARIDILAIISPKEPSMRYSLAIEGFERQKIEAEISFWTGPRLLINDAPAPKGTRRGEMVLTRDDGTQVTAFWILQLLGLDVPQLFVGGKIIKLVAPLKWYQVVWAALPIGLALIGMVVGAIVGVAAFIINTRIFRSALNEYLKYVLVSFVSIVSFFVYLLGAVLAGILVAMIV
jgi:hypothetical protein